MQSKQISNLISNQAESENLLLVNIFRVVLSSVVVILDRDIASILREHHQLQVGLNGDTITGHSISIEHIIYYQLCNHAL